MTAGQGMMVPGFSMFPYANPYLSYQGPYGPMSNYSSLPDERILERVNNLNDESVKI